jgi:hypothetical protein
MLESAGFPGHIEDSLFEDMRAKRGYSWQVGRVGKGFSRAMIRCDQSADSARYVVPCAKNLEAIKSPRAVAVVLQEYPKTRNRYGSVDFIRLRPTGREAWVHMYTKLPLGAFRQTVVPRWTRFVVVYSVRGGWTRSSSYIATFKRFLII